MTEPILTDLETGVAENQLSVQFIFDAMDNAEIRYALLRGFEELIDPKDNLEMDLLVHSEDIETLSAALGQLGFVETPSWGHSPHKFFITYSTELGFWLKLDVVTALYYGAPFRHLKLNLTELCLHQRVRDGIFVLSNEHEFITTFLHCLLDKGRFDEKHRVRLQELAEMMQNDARLRARLGNIVHQYISPALGWPDVLDLVTAGDWRGLLGLQDKLAERLSRQEPVANAMKKLGTAFVRKLRPLLFAFRCHGVSAVLLAPDGAGKSTLAQGLKNDKMLRAKLVYMGTNIEALNVKLPTTTYLMKEIKAVRKQGKKARFGVFIRGLNLVNSIFDHWYRCLYARYHLLRGHFVVFDRYIYDAWIQKRKNSAWKKFRRFIFDVVCPTPDLVFFLDAPGEVLFRRKQEHSPEWIDQQRAGYHKLQDVLSQMVIVDASQTADQVRGEVISLIWRKYGSGVNKNLYGRSSGAARKDSDQ